MAIDKAVLEDKARKQYIAKMRKKVMGMLITRPFALKSYLAVLNSIIEAGHEMGVAGDAEIFSDEEIEEIFADLKPLLELEMYEEVKNYFLPILVQKKFDEEVLLPLLVGEKPDGEESEEATGEPEASPA